MDVLGVGVLLSGKSGIGKSECALDLVIRGHRLVADDMVFIKKKMPAVLVGQAEESLQYLMEIRGLGIINIKDLYGVSAIRDKKIVDMLLELVEWDESHEYDRLGVDDRTTTILGTRDTPHHHTGQTGSQSGIHYRSCSAQLSAERYGVSLGT